MCKKIPLILRVLPTVSLKYTFHLFWPEANRNRIGGYIARRDLSVQVCVCARESARASARVRSFVVDDNQNKRHLVLSVMLFAFRISAKYLKISTWCQHCKPFCNLGLFFGLKKSGVWKVRPDGTDGLMDIEARWIEKCGRKGIDTGKEDRKSAVQ